MSTITRHMFRMPDVAFRTLTSPEYVMGSRPCDYSSVQSDYARLLGDTAKGELVWRMVCANAAHHSGACWFGLHYDKIVEAMHHEASHHGNTPPRGLLLDAPATWFDELDSARRIMIDLGLLAVIDDKYLLPTKALVARLEALLSS